MSWNKQMAAEYRESAEKLTRRAEELREQAMAAASRSDANELRRRAITLETNAAEILAKASYLDRYYGRDD